MSDPWRDLPWSSLLQTLRDEVTIRARGGQHEHGPSAWAEIARRLRAIAYSQRFRQFGLGRSDVDDVVQTMLVRMQSVSTLESLQELRHPYSYFARTIRNAGIDLARKRKTATVYAEQERKAIPSRDEQPEQDHIRDLMKSLPERDQELLRLRFWEAASLREIGEELRISTSAAGVRVFRLLRRLRLILEREAATATVNGTSDDPHE